MRGVKHSSMHGRRIEVCISKFSIGWKKGMGGKVMWLVELVRHKEEKRRNYYFQTKLGKQVIEDVKSDFCSLSLLFFPFFIHSFDQNFFFPSPPLPSPPFPSPICSVFFSCLLLWEQPVSLTGVALNNCCTEVLSVNFSSHSLQILKDWAGVVSVVVCPSTWRYIFIKVHCWERLKKPWHWVPCCKKGFDFFQSPVLLKWATDGCAKPLSLITPPIFVFKYTKVTYLEYLLIH